MSNHKNLVFFNKEGDYLNFNYNEVLGRFEGDILFHENSNDTYKTYGINTLEKTPAFEYELPGQLVTKKWQLFNEYGLNLYGSIYKEERVIKVEPVNNDPSFNSKWIMGNEFDKKFPIGSSISFDIPFLSFSNKNKTYTVVAVKKDAIMIIGTMDNDTFEINYSQIYSNPSSYDGITISGRNMIGVYNYIDIQTLSDNLSLWNEPEFYLNYFINKRLNIVNSKFNNKTVSVINDQLIDNTYTEYHLNENDLPNSFSNLIIEVELKTDLPKIYENYINIGNDSRLELNINYYPDLLTPGTEFKLVGTQLNDDIFLTVSDIPNWDGIVNLMDFKIGDQVIFDNKIYQCIVAYTQDFSDNLTAYLTPKENTINWGRPTFVKVRERTFSENLLNARIYLTTNKFEFIHEYDSNIYNSPRSVMVSATERFKNMLSFLNIDILFKGDTIYSKLIFPSNYAIVNYYYDTTKVGRKESYLENLVEVRENLTTELNRDFSENYNYNIVFNRLNEYGLKIDINGMVYDAEFDRVISAGQIDLIRSVDRTLRNWLSRYYLTLYTLGIIADVKYTGNGNSIYYNSISLRTEFPNVPLNVEKVRVGTTGEYYIEHSEVLFTEIGPYFNIIINGSEYGIESSYNGNQPDITLTISKWVDKYKRLLGEYGIRIESVNNLLRFAYLNLDGRSLEYTLKTGLVDIPGLGGYKINKKQTGNHGLLIASNEVIIESTTASVIPALGNFITEGFSTGMVFSINNTYFPWVNQEFNIEYVDDNLLNLSYEGPFWGNADGICNSSAFTIIAFNAGFNASGCIDIPLGSGGEFDKDEFDDSFTVEFNPNTYETQVYNLNQYPGSDNLADILYLQLTNSVYALGDNMIIFDAYLAQHIGQIDLTSYSTKIKMEFNTVNNYLYVLTSSDLIIVDPLLNKVINSANISNPNDMCINQSSGDIYVSFSNEIRVYGSNLNNPFILNSLSPNFPPTSTGGYKMLYCSKNEHIYVLLDNDIIEIELNRSIYKSINITGINSNFITYDHQNNEIVVSDNINIIRLDLVLNDLNKNISINNTPHSGLFNNFNNDIVISSQLPEVLFINEDNISSNLTTNYYGCLEINQFDGDIYLSDINGSHIAVIDSHTKSVIYNESTTSEVIKLIYNPQRHSIWGIQPTDKALIEIQVILGAEIIDRIDNKPVGENLYGTLDPNYIKPEEIWLKTREYVRTPRENMIGEAPVKYYWKWLSDDKPEFFLYDFSGKQLSNEGAYTYTGIKPLENIILNKNANRDIYSIDKDVYQRTIFDEIEFDLDPINLVSDNNRKITPLQLFIGFKSEYEGPSTSTLQLFKRERISFTLSYDRSNINTDSYITIENDELDSNIAILRLNENSPHYFTDLYSFNSEYRLKEGQLIKIYLKDLYNDTNQYISHNNGLEFEIKEIYAKQILLYKNGNDIIDESTIVIDKQNGTTIAYLDFTLEVIDKEIGRFNVYGQTEEEDERFKIELGNIGKLINPDDVFIFKEYDILEGGLDWRIMNMKRKEMLMMKHLIYPYIGAYKSIINAINYFGYNDLQLNEYYRNINTESPLFGQLYKVEIPKIFDNNIDGWEENDYIKNTYPNENYEDTNLFNLTYFITDKNGNNILHYSLDEIIIKLQGLKYWLKRNIIPLTHKILDITGVSYVNQTSSILHRLHDIQIFNIKENMTPITGKLNEAYIAPIDSGSAVYTCVIDLYTIIPNMGTEDYLKEKPLPLNGSELILPDVYTIKIRTYKTYREWEPFKEYAMGDTVKYYDKLYESVLDGNKTKNPRRYENIKKWSSSVKYNKHTIVEYNRDYYVYTSLGEISNIIYNDDNQSIISDLINGDNKIFTFDFNGNYNLRIIYCDKDGIALGTEQTYTSSPIDIDVNYFKIEILTKDGSILDINDLGSFKPTFTYVYKKSEPPFNIVNWLKITEWKEVDYNPVQVISEFRVGDDLRPFNFTVDSNIDPFLNITITSDNGYGEIYSDIKNYEIRGLDDLGASSVYELDSLPVLSNPLIDPPVSYHSDPIITDKGCSGDDDFEITIDNLVLRFNIEPDINTYINLIDDTIDVPGQGEFDYSTLEFQVPEYGSLSYDPNNSNVLIYTGTLNGLMDTFTFTIRNTNGRRSNRAKICIQGVMEYIIKVEHTGVNTGNDYITYKKGRDAIDGNVYEFEGEWFYIVEDNDDLRNVIELYAGNSSGYLDEQFAMIQGHNIDVNHLVMTNVDNMDRLFKGSLIEHPMGYGIIGLDPTIFNKYIGSWDMINVVSIEEMFSGSVFNQHINGWNMSSVINMTKTFMVSQFNNELSDWDVSSVTNFSGAFQSCTSLTTLDVSNWDVSSVTNFGNAFASCSSLMTLDVSNWDVSSVTNFSGAFQSCTSLTTLDVSNWDVSSVTNFSGAFQSCTSLTTLDVSNWDVSSVATFAQAFRYCSSLTTLDVSNWDVSSVTYFGNAFENCTSLITLDVSNWDVSSVTSFYYAFRNCTSLTTLDVSGWDVSSVTDFGIAFQNCTSLTTLDVSNWDVSNVTNMGYMFYNCQLLTTLDVSNWDVSSVTNFGSAFTSCSSLTTLDVSNWDVSSVTNFAQAFRDCTSLTTLDVSNWDVSSVTSFYIAFLGCTSLMTLDVSNWDVSSVINFGIAFQNCTSLTTLDVSNWDVSSVTNFSGAFQFCTNLNIDIDWTDPIIGSINLKMMNGALAGSKIRSFKIQAGAITGFSNVSGNPSNPFASSNLQELILIDLNVDLPLVGLGTGGATILDGNAIDDLANSVRDMTLTNETRNVTMTISQKNSCDNSIWANKGWNILT